MAKRYEVYDKTPLGSPRSYLDTQTGQIISNREYRGITTAQPKGFATYGDYLRARAAIKVTSVKMGYVQIQHEMGRTADLKQAIGTIIKEKGYDSDMTANIHVHYRNSSGDTKTVSTPTIFIGDEDDGYDAEYMDDGASDVLDSYDVDEVIGYTLVIYP